MSGQRPGPLLSRHQGAANPPTAGTRRPRSPEPKLHAGTRAPDATTKSPYTDRIIKRGRSDTNARGATPPTRTKFTFAASATPHIAVGPAESTTLNSATDTAGKPADPVKQLVELMQAALGLVTELQATLPITPDVRAILSMAESIRDTLQKTRATTTAPDTLAGIPRPTYAEAATTKAPPAPASEPPARRTVTKARRPSRRNSRRNDVPTTSPDRLIIDFGPDFRPNPEDIPTLLELRDGLNNAIPPPARIKAVSYSRTRNLILHTDRTICDAAALIEFESQLRTYISETIGPGVPTAAYVDNPWHPVVVHNVPLIWMESKDEENTEELLVPPWNTICQELQTKNTFDNIQRRIAGAEQTKWMWPKGHVTTERTLSASLRLSFFEEADAKRFLRDGMYLFGSWCRVSRYKPRGRPRPPALSSRPT